MPAALVAIAALGTAGLTRVIRLVTRGLRAAMARKAAVKSQATAIHRTGIQDPVSSKILAAPHPAKMDAVPLAVYWIP